MLVESTNIVGAKEIVERLERAHSSIVHAWRMRNIGFPEPVITLSAGMFWEWDKVEEWSKNRKVNTKEVTQ